MKKRLAELVALRMRMLLLFAAILVAIGYLTYAFFQFYKSASAIINNYKDDGNDDDEPEEEEEEEEPTASAGNSPNGQAERKPEPKSESA